MKEKERIDWLEGKSFINPALLRRLVRETGIQADARLVELYVAAQVISFARSGRQYYEGKETIASDLGVSCRTVQRMTASSRCLARVGKNGDQRWPWILTLATGDTIGTGDTSVSGDRNGTGGDSPVPGAGDRSGHDGRQIRVEPETGLSPNTSQLVKPGSERSEVKLVSEEPPSADDDDQSGEGERPGSAGGPAREGSDEQWVELVRKLFREAVEEALPAGSFEWYRNERGDGEPMRVVNVLREKGLLTEENVRRLCRLKVAQLKAGREIGRLAPGYAADLADTLEAEIRRADSGIKHHEVRRIVNPLGHGLTRMLGDGSIPAPDKLMSACCLYGVIVVGNWLGRTALPEEAVADLIGKTLRMEKIPTRIKIAFKKTRTSEVGAAAAKGVFLADWRERFTDAWERAGCDFDEKVNPVPSSQLDEFFEHSVKHLGDDCAQGDGAASLFGDDG